VFSGVSQVDFDTGIADARVSEACGWVVQFEHCLGDLPLPNTSGEREELKQMEGVLGANQIKFACPEPKEVKRRDTAMTTANGNVNIDVDSASDFHVSRVTRESVDLIQMNTGIKKAESESAAAAAEMAQLKTDIAAEIADITRIRDELTDHNKATIDVAKLGARVDNLDSLVGRVSKLSAEVAAVADSLASTKKNLLSSAEDVADDIGSDQAEFEKVMDVKVAAAVAAANEAKVIASNLNVDAATLPAGASVQVIDKMHENESGNDCESGYCKHIPHYGNNLNQFTKIEPCFIEITPLRKNSHFLAEFMQYTYTNGGSHYYMDYKRTVDGRNEKSLLAENRKSGITDQIFGGHPNGRDGISNVIVFLDRLAKADVGAKVRYQLYYASWNSGRVHFSGYNTNERTLNWYTLSEIAA
jgi:hypothetical protein